MSPKKVSCLNCWKVATRVGDFMDYFCINCGFRWSFVDHDGEIKMHYDRIQPNKKKRVETVPAGTLPIFMEASLWTSSK